MYAVREKTRTVSGAKLRTFSREVDRRNVLEAEAGTDGSRTFIALRDWWRTDLRVRALGKDGNGGVELTMNGPDELLTVTEALEFILRVLREEGADAGGTGRGR